MSGPGRAPRAGVPAVAVAALLASGACDSSGADAGRAASVPEGTRRMAARLDSLTDPSDYEARIAALERMRPTDDLRARLTFGARHAQLLARAGRLDEALSAIHEMQEIVDADRRRVPAPFQLDLMDLEAIVTLWPAIHEACMASTEACTFPLPAERFAGDERVGRALTLYSGLLRSRPGDGSLIWLANLAAMAAGRHPGAVPEEALIPPEAFASEADIGRFTDRAASLGVDATGHAGGAVMDDLDGDGDLDLMASSLALDENLRYFRNDGGSFTDRTEAAGLAGLTGGLNLLQADYDGDGDLDVLVLRGGWGQEGQPNSLLRNEGDGTFADVTEAAGLLSSRPTQTAGWADYDGDGDLDLFIGNESVASASPPQIAPAELYRNEGDGTFAEVAAEVGLDVVGFIKSVAWGDVDGDGRPDLYLSRLGEPNLLFRNEGPVPGGGWSFSDITARAGVGEPRESFPAWFWDYDNDGHLDLFVSGYRLRPGDVAAEYLGQPEEGALPRLYRNRGDGTFEDVTAAAGLERVLYTMGSNYGDLDGDGWLDLYAGTGEPDLRALVPNRVLRNGPGAGDPASRRFEDITASGGFGHLGKGHGVAFGDLDFDGDQDLYAVIGGAVQGDVGRNILLENPGHGHRWITLRLVGVEANRFGVGARVRVAVEGPDGPRDIHVLAGSGGSFGASSLQQEIGLGNAAAIHEIEVRWPGSGRVDTLPGPPLDGVYRVTEGEGRAVPVEVAPFRLGGEGGP